MHWVLLPGMDGTGELFAPFLSTLPPDVKPLVIGYPRTEKLSYEELEKLVCRSLPSEPFILVAESFSGPIAVRIAERSPTNLCALVLCATFVQFPAGRIVRLLAGTMGPFVFNLRPPRCLLRYFLLGNASPELEALVSGVIGKTSPGVMCSRLKSILSVDACESMARLKTPTLVLIGTKDRVVERDNAEKMKRLNESLVVARIDAPHLLLQTRPREAFAAIQRFVSKLPTHS